MPFNEQLPEWNAPGIEPPASKKNIGWQAGEKPPADYWNWQMNRTYKALQELQQKAAEKVDVQQAQQTADDARNDIDALTADYEQNAIKTTGDWEMSGELTLHKFNIGNTEWITTHAVTFGNNSYEKVDIEIPKSQFFGTFEITLNGSFNEGNATGSITKVIHAGFREDGRIDFNESYYTQVSSLTANHFAISDIIFDPVKDKFVIKIVHRTSLSVNTRIIVKGRVGAISSLNVIKQITFSDIYTTDTTQYERPYRTGVIVESGENANGQYVRFADGTQICWRIIEVDTSRTDAQTFAFPASFSVTREYIAVGYGLHRPGQDHADAWYEGRGVVASTESSWTARFRSDQSSIVDVVEIRVIAIGRWK